MGREQLTDEDLVSRFSQITNRDTAMSAAMGFLKDTLSQRYEGLEIRPHIKSYIDGSDELKGYHLVERAKLDKPEIEVKKSLFGLIRREIPKTHNERGLVYGDLDAILYVKVNEKDIVRACDEVAIKSDGSVSVKLTF